MSKLNNISYTFGKQFNIAVANTYSYILLDSGSNLPANSIIISSPIDSNGNDTGTYSIIGVDYEGTGVRLSYQFNEGDGIKIDVDNLSIGIDNRSIKDNSNSLFLDLTYMVDNSTIKYSYEYGKIYVDTQELTTASSTEMGVVSVDENTISSDEGMLYIQTQNLDYSNTSSNTYGILYSDSNKVNIKNGIISINTQNLRKCTNTEYGIAKGDEFTILSQENGLSVNEDNLDKLGVDTFGTVSVDNTTLRLNEGNISVNTSSLTKASEDEVGIVKIDGNTVILDSEDRITVNGYKEINTDIDSLNTKLDKYIESLSEMESEIMDRIK